MAAADAPAPWDEDPVIRLIVQGRAGSLSEAEELYLDESIPEALELLAGPWSDEELSEHPLFVLLRTRGSRGWEDSLL